MRLLNYVLLSTLTLCPLQLLAIPSATTANTDETYGLHLDWIDKNIAPDQNFYQFANGMWQQQNPIPAAYASWGIFQLLQKQNQEIIRSILEDAAKNNPGKPGSEEQKVGDFYYSGMDEATIDKAGITPIQPEFERINNIQNLTTLQKTITHLQMIGVDTVFGFGQMQDFKNSKNVIGIAGQGGLGLPDRDYYLKDEPKFQQIRRAYVEHITRMLELLGDPTATATAEAKLILSIETTFAKASMPLTDQRNPQAIYHPKTLAQLTQITPNFSWKQYFIDIGHPEITSINLAMPEFFKALNTQLKNIPLDDWKIYLRWQLIHSLAPYLSKPFVDENFRLTAILTGSQELLPRWQRVSNAADEALGFAIGKLYVEKAFPPSSKMAVLEILHNIRQALREDLKTLAWMTPETRQAAIKKLDMMQNRIGYPDKWWDYSTLKIDRGPYVLNVIRAAEFVNRREYNKIGKPVDRTEWSMTPQTVNAYYDPSMNNLNIPAGILQPPFFDPKAPAAVNYGALGFVIGHEMTHGFDDQGAKFDGHGNLKNWWMPEDLKKFQLATNCISNQFSQYTVVGNTKVQGKLVTGEATADLGGLILAYRAYHASDAYKKAHTIAGYTPDQQFFLGAAHVWARNVRPEEERRLVIIDPHPPAIYRVNGSLANISQFQQTFQVPDSSPMVNKHRCVIW